MRYENSIDFSSMKPCVVKVIDEIEAGVNDDSPILPLQKVSTSPPMSVTRPLK